MKRDHHYDVISNPTDMPSPGWLRRALLEDDHDLATDLRLLLRSPRYSQSVPRGAIVAALLGVLLIATTLIAERGLHQPATNTDAKQPSSDYGSTAGTAPADASLPAAHFDTQMQAYSGIDSVADQPDYTLAMLEASGGTAGNQSFVGNNGAAAAQSGAGFAGSQISAGGFGGGGPQSEQTGSTTGTTTAVPDGGSSLLFFAGGLATMIAGQRVIFGRAREPRNVVR